MNSLPSFFDPRRDRNNRSKKQERERADEIGGRRQSGSGSSHRAPQDVRSDTDLEQLKFTDKDRITILVSDLIKTYADAMVCGREPGYVVNFSKHHIRMVISIERVTKK